MASIEEVRAAVEKMARHILKLYITTNNYAEYVSRYHLTQPMLSISMEGCMEKGMDCTAGGCKYNGYGGTATGLATLADSLSTIKYMCFDKSSSPPAAVRRVDKQLGGLRAPAAKILSTVPHYGNADPYADEELKWCVSLYYAICSECYSTRAPKYSCGLYGAADHIAQGWTTFATPTAGGPESLGGAMSPAQGRDVNGPTPCSSTCCFDHRRFAGGLAEYEAAPQRFQPRGRRGKAARYDEGVF